MGAQRLPVQDAHQITGFHSGLADHIGLRLGALYHVKGCRKDAHIADYDCLLPEFMNITGGKRTDNKAAFDIEIKPHSIVVADRGYCDYGLLNHWDSNNVFYVVRHKDDIQHRTIKELPLPEKHAQNVLLDEIIEFELPTAKDKCPKRLRRIAVWDEEHGFVIELLSNNVTLAASTIAKLYKARWNIEIFFHNLNNYCASRALSASRATP